MPGEYWALHALWNVSVYPEFQSLIIQIQNQKHVYRKKASDITHLVAKNTSPNTAVDKDFRRLIWAMRTFISLLDIKSF